MSYQFPKGFLWGSATSAHQVEGNNRNDWTEWELKNAERLSQKGGGKYPPRNYISGKACDHYNRFREDFDIAKQLGHNAHRFSIEWSRVEPEEGRFNEKEIEHYLEVIQFLRECGLEPFVTLWHWTLPLWLRDKGGVSSASFPKYFSRYAEYTAREIGKNVTFWITLNEPLVLASQGYLKGIWPPQQKSLLIYFKVLQHLVEAHKQAYVVMKNINQETQIGIAKNNIFFEGKGINKALTYLVDWWWNKRFLDKIKNSQDFIGLNYYLHHHIKGLKFKGLEFNRNENRAVSDMGWEIYPKGIYYLLKDLQLYQKPIYITENGIADAKDVRRAAFIRDHKTWMQKATEEGVDLRGYFYWSLMDNFEWDKGFWPRFGLVEIDYKTMERKIRQSARRMID